MNSSIFLVPTGVLYPLVRYYMQIQLFEIFTQPIDAIDATRVTLSRLNRINTIDVTRATPNSLNCINFNVSFVTLEGDGLDESTSPCKPLCSTDMFVYLWVWRWVIMYYKVLSVWCWWWLFDLCPCSTDQFACADGSKCISKSDVCDGHSTCDALPRSSS